MLFVQKQYQYLANQIAAQEEAYTFLQFDNQEYALSFAREVVGQTCLVLGSMTGPADQVVQLLLLLQALSNAGAKTVSLFSPYLGYQRQDAGSLKSSHGLSWADTMVHAAGVSKIITIEPHNPQALLSLKVPVFFYSAEYIFEADIARFVSLGFTFIFPDAGAVARYQWLSKKFPATQQGSFIKHREHAMVHIQEFHGKISRKVIIYDDILDSGQTLINICIALRQLGVEEIVIFVTHAFFHGTAWNDLWNLGVKALYCTDSLPAAHTMNHLYIQKKSIAHFLQNSI